VHPDGLVVAPVGAGPRVPAELRLPDLLPSNPSHEAADVEDDRVADLDIDSIDRDACHRSRMRKRQDELSQAQGYFSF
jgi:hypothetical protein